MRCAIFLLLSLVFQHSLCAITPFQPYKAVVIAPIVDAVGGPLADIFKYEEIERQYDEFPSAPDKGYYSCLRIHQLKYNEVVTVKSAPYGRAEVECEVSNLFYLDRRGKKRRNFSLLKKHLMPLSELEKKIDSSTIPQPIDMKKTAAEYNAAILTLVMPWLDEKTKTWYSAGTRFVRCPENDTVASYAFYLTDYANFSTYKGYVPKKKAIVAYPKTAEKMRALFLKILKSWANSVQGFIPYVFGGTSFTTRYKRDEFSLVFGRRAGRRVSYWQRYPNNEMPAAGFDCSGMLLTAAQIAGIPYFLKNTWTLTEDCGRPLKKNDKLEQGDLIWYFGHVMVVSDIKKNMLIEAVGYEAGYGKMHELPVSRVFTGIKTYAELVQAYHTKRSLKRLNSKGEPYRSIKRLKILKLL